MRQRLAAGRVSSVSASEENELSEPGQAHNPGAPVQPRQAASVILLRDESSELELPRDEPNELELLLVKRTPKARFMGGVWVFPGGAVDAGEGDGEEAHRRAAIRELREETGIVLDDPAALLEFSRWITPAEVQIRFDTHFFLAVLPPGQEPHVDGEECVEQGWFTPQGALEANRAGEIELVFPTIKHLEQLSDFASVDALMAYAHAHEVRPVHPRVLLEGEVARIVLPGEPGYY
jgi:8-oxo-dGTP pyrophosphatase MutT (NUDIX family)